MQAADSPTYLRGASSPPDYSPPFAATPTLQETSLFHSAVIVALPHTLNITPYYICYHASTDDELLALALANTLRRHYFEGSVFDHR